MVAWKKMKRGESQEGRRIIALGQYGGSSADRFTQGKNLIGMRSGYEVKCGKVKRSKVK